MFKCKQRLNLRHLLNQNDPFNREREKHCGMTNLTDDVKEVQSVTVINIGRGSGETRLVNYDTGLA